MSQIFFPTRFPANGVVQRFLVATSGNYVITATGAEGGASERAGGRGAFAEGRFYLRLGDVLFIVVGQQGRAGETPLSATDQMACGGGGGGGTFVWVGTAPEILPEWPLLVAGGGGGGGRLEGGAGRPGSESVHRMRSTPVGPRGQGGLSDPCWHFAGGGGAGWRSAGANGPGPVYCEGGHHWAGGEGVAYGNLNGGSGGFGGGGGGGFMGHACGGGGGFVGGVGGGLVESKLGWASPSEGGVSYNAGLSQINHHGTQRGDGYVTIAAAHPFFGEFSFPRFRAASPASNSATTSYFPP